MAEQKTILHADAFKPASVSAAALGGLAKLRIDSFDDALARQNTFEKFPELKALGNNRERRRWLNQKQREMRRESAEMEQQLQRHHEQARLLGQQRDVIDDLVSWMDGGLKLQRCESPSFRAMRRAVADGQTLYMAKDLYAQTPALDFEKEIFRFAEILTVEHDWAAAFKSADLKDVTIRLPYDVCAFEFKLSGRPLIALATQFEADVVFTPIMHGLETWCVPDYVIPISGYSFDYAHEGMLTLFEQISAQIVAICVALDAKVAKSEVVREQYSGVKSGSNTYSLPKGYHVVSLAHRSARPLEPTDGQSSRRVRLHFRRGHWRHFQDHKTWINWMLVGDPDLGFVEKHYRL